VDFEGLRDEREVPDEAAERWVSDGGDRARERLRSGGDSETMENDNTV
jgi:hypothetical protein